MLLARKRQRVRVGSAAPFVLVDARSHEVHLPARTLRFGVPLRLGSTVLVPPIRVEPGAQPLVLDGVGYRGTLTLLRGKRSAARSDRQFSIVTSVPIGV